MSRFVSKIDLQQRIIYRRVYIMGEDQRDDLLATFNTWLERNKSVIINVDVDALTAAYTYALDVYRSERRHNGELTIQTIMEIAEVLTYTPADTLTYLIAFFCKSSDLLVQDQKIKELHPELPEFLQKYFRLASFHVQRHFSSFSNTLAQMFFVIADNPRITLVRLADRLVNLKTTSHFELARQHDIAEKSLHIYGPLAKVLGLSHIYTNLQNEAFKILHPLEYTNLETITQEITKEYGEITDNFIRELEDDISKEIKKYTISKRYKNPYSIYKKINQKFPHIPFHDTKAIKEHMYDIIGIRVLVETEEECFFVLSCLTEKFPSSLTTKNYITHPKPNGYQSIHHYVKLGGKVHLEVQIRTFDMHEKNEFGNASHFYYKEVDPTSKKINSDNWLSNIVAWQEDIQGSPLSSIQYFQKNIYTLTPKGDIIQLPSGSIALDFAYSIHQDIGDHALQAYINDKLVSLDHPLNNGDTVFIRTGKRETPPTKFLHQIKTREAKKALSRHKRRI